MYEAGVGLDCLLAWLGVNYFFKEKTSYIIFTDILTDRIIGKKYSQENSPQGPGGGPFRAPNFKIAISWKIFPLTYPKKFLTFQSPQIKKFQEAKKFIYYPRMLIQEKIWNQRQKQFQLEKGIFFKFTLIQALVSKTLRLFYKIFVSLQNIKTLTLLTLLGAEINGGPKRPPPGPFVWQKGPWGLMKVFRKSIFCFASFHITWHHLSNINLKKMDYRAQGSGFLFCDKGIEYIYGIPPILFMAPSLIK